MSIDKSKNNKNMNNKKSFSDGKSKPSPFFRRFGVFLIIFFISSFIYLFWLYILPFCLNNQITEDKINNFIKPRLNLTARMVSSDIYTTPSLGIGIKVKDLKLIYPGAASISSEERVFLNAKSAFFEIAFIPYLMKTIKFNEFLLRGVSVNTYQNENGQYAYKEHFIANFNPSMEKYVLEVPTITLLSYTFDNYNQQTGEFKKEAGSSMVIKPITTKSLLSKSQWAKTIILK